MLCVNPSMTSASRKVGRHPPLGEYLIHDYVVVRRAWRAHNGTVRLQEEITVSTLGQVTVDKGAALGIGLLIGLISGAGEKAGMVAFTNNDDGDAGKFPSCVWRKVQLSTSPYELRKLFIKHFVVLIFRHPISVDKEVLRKRMMVS